MHNQRCFKSLGISLVYMNTLPDQPLAYHPIPATISSISVNLGAAQNTKGCYYVDLKWPLLGWHLFDIKLLLGMQRSTTRNPTKSAWFNRTALVVGANLPKQSAWNRLCIDPKMITFDQATRGLACIPPGPDSASGAASRQSERQSFSRTASDATETDLQISTKRQMPHNARVDLLGITPFLLRQPIPHSTWMFGEQLVVVFWNCVSISVSYEITILSTFHFSWAAQSSRDKCAAYLLVMGGQW